MLTGIASPAHAHVLQSVLDQKLGFWAALVKPHFGSVIAMKE
jgi:hypothetical protein